MTQVLGRQLENVTIKRSRHGLHTLESRDEWCKCRNLRELSLSGLGAEQIRPVFSTPKPHLKKLYLQSRKREGDVKGIMEILCQGAPKVEEFTVHYTGGGPNSAWSSMGTFFELNNSSLSDVSLSQRYSNNNVGEMIQILWLESSLKEIRCVGVPPEKLLKTMGNLGVQCRSWHGKIYYYPF